MEAANLIIANVIINRVMMIIKNATKTVLSSNDKIEDCFDCDPGMVPFRFTSVILGPARAFSVKLWKRLNNGAQWIGNAVISGKGAQLQMSDGAQWQEA